ncbi:hypothetical protein Sjap_005656 [Stephania japonica]|uniref:Uncharacterized protein n=1 Tax=Stephania japonica TaxID=461633 RepID=A0AAP0K4H6_9MAGN
MASTFKMADDVLMHLMGKAFASFATTTLGGNESARKSEHDSHAMQSQSHTNANEFSSSKRREHGKLQHKRIKQFSIVGLVKRSVTSQSCRRGSSDDVSGDVTGAAGLAGGRRGSQDDLRNWGRHRRFGYASPNKQRRFGPA